jgi:pyruvate dehydrogenase E2 component (dihydrolipoamide acetyltransferase)
VATPRARRRARELGVDWSLARGTGRNGRIRERDVVALAGRSPSLSQGESTPVTPGRHQPATRLRQSIAQRMLAGVQQPAPVTLTTKVDATALVSWRTQAKLAAADRIVPTYTDIIVKLVAEALANEPRLNACWLRDGIYTYDAINIAVAVDTEYGLVAPVINNVRNLSLREVAERSRNLAEQARAGTLAQNQLGGGTFTVTNLGLFGIDFFTPIINLPQAAILGIGRIVREPVVRGDAIVIGQTLALSLTFDHRVIDGAPAARWLRRLAELIEQPADFLHSQVEPAPEP